MTKVDESLPTQNHRSGDSQIQHVVVVGPVRALIDADQGSTELLHWPALTNVVLYWGMYMQAVQLIMYSSVALGLAALAAAYIWSTRAINEREARAGF